MAGLVPAIHVFVSRKDMDARHKPGMTAKKNHSGLIFSATGVHFTSSDAMNVLS